MLINLGPEAMLIERFDCIIYLKTISHIKKAKEFVTTNHISGSS